MMYGVSTIPLGITQNHVVEVVFFPSHVSHRTGEHENQLVQGRASLMALVQYTGPLGRRQWRYDPTERVGTAQTSDTLMAVADAGIGTILSRRHWRSLTHFTHASIATLHRGQQPHNASSKHAGTTERHSLL